MMIDLAKQFSRFTGVGMISAVGHYGLFFTLMLGLSVEPVTASAAGALLGAVINYALNYRFTFRSTKRHRDAILKFGMVALVGLLLNTFFMWVGVYLLGMHPLPSQIVTTGLVLVWSFIGNRYWAFHPGSP